MKHPTQLNIGLTKKTILSSIILLSLMGMLNALPDTHLTINTTGFLVIYGNGTDNPTLINGTLWVNGNTNVSGDLNATGRICSSSGCITSYSAGNGISLAGSVFSVSGGTGLIQDSGGLSLNETYMSSKWLSNESCAAGELYVWEFGCISNTSVGQGGTDWGANISFLMDNASIQESWINNILGNISFLMDNATQQETRINTLYVNLSFIHDNLTAIDGRLDTIETLDHTDWGINISWLTDNTTDLSTRVDSLEGSTDLSGNVSFLHDNATAVDGRLDTLEGYDHTDWTLNISFMHDNLTAIDGRLDTIEGQTDLSGNVSFLHDNATAVDGRLDTLEGYDHTDWTSQITFLENNATNQDTRITTLEGQTDLSGNVSFLHDNATAVDGRLDTLEGYDHTDWTSQITFLENNATNQDTRITTLEGQVDLSGNVSFLHDNATAVDGRLDTLETNDPNDFDQESDLTSLLNDNYLNINRDTNISFIHDNLTAVDGRLDTLEGQTDLSANVSFLHDNATAVDGRLDTLEGYDHTDWTSQITFLENNATNQDTRITTLEGQTDLSGNVSFLHDNATAVDGRLDTLETNDPNDFDEESDLTSLLNDNYLNINRDSNISFLMDNASHQQTDINTLEGYDHTDWTSQITFLENNATNQDTRITTLEGQSDLSGNVSFLHDNATAVDGRLDTLETNDPSDFDEESDLTSLLNDNYLNINRDSNISFLHDNATAVDGRLDTIETNYLKKDGSVALTADWDAGGQVITSASILADAGDVNASNAMYIGSDPLIGFGTLTDGKLCVYNSAGNIVICNSDPSSVEAEIDLVTGDGLTGGQDNVMVGSDADVTISIDKSYLNTSIDNRVNTNISYLMDNASHQQTDINALEDLDHTDWSTQITFLENNATNQDTRINTLETNDPSDFDQESDLTSLLNDNYLNINRDTNISFIHDNLTAIDGRLDTLEGSTDLSGNVSFLHDNATAVDGRLDTLEGYDHTDWTNNITFIHDNLTDHETRLDTLDTNDPSDFDEESDLTSLLNDNYLNINRDSNISFLMDNATEQETNINFLITNTTNLSQRVTLLEGSTDLSANVSFIHDNLTAIDGRLDTLDGYDHTDWTNNISFIHDNLTDHETRIDTLDTNDPNDFDEESDLTSLLNDNYLNINRDSNISYLMDNASHQQTDINTLEGYDHTDWTDNITFIHDNLTDHETRLDTLDTNDPNDFDEESDLTSLLNDNYLNINRDTNISYLMDNASHQQTDINALEVLDHTDWNGNISFLHDNATAVDGRLDALEAAGDLSANVSFLHDNATEQANQLITLNQRDCMISSGIINASSITTKGNVNTVDTPSSLYVWYPNMTILSVNSTCDKTICVVPTGNISVTDNQHTVYYVDNDCAVKSTSTTNMKNADISNGAIPWFMTVLAHDADVETHKGAVVSNNRYFNIIRNQYYLDNLKVVSGMDIDFTSGSLEWVSRSGNYLYIESIVSATEQNTTKDGVDFYYRTAGTWTDSTNYQLNVTHCDDGTNLVACDNVNKYRRYPMAIMGFENGVDTSILHQFAAQQSETFTSIAQCEDLETSPITNEYPSFYNDGLVVTHIACCQASTTDFDMCGQIDLRGSTGGANSGGIDTSSFLLTDGSRNITADWDAGQYKITSASILADAGDVNASNKIFIGADQVLGTWGINISFLHDNATAVDGRLDTLETNDPNDFDEESDLTSLLNDNYLNINRDSNISFLMDNATQQETDINTLQAYDHTAYWQDAGAYTTSNGAVNNGDVNVSGNLLIEGTIDIDEVTSSTFISFKPNGETDDGLNLSSDGNNMLLDVFGGGDLKINLHGQNKYLHIDDGSSNDGYAYFGMATLSDFYMATAGTTNMVLYPDASLILAPQGSGGTQITGHMHFSDNEATYYGTGDDYCEYWNGTGKVEEAPCTL